MHLPVFVWLLLLALPCSVQGRQLSFTSYPGVVEEATLPNSAAKYDGKQFEDLISEAEAAKGSKIDSAIFLAQKALTVAKKLGSAGKQAQANLMLGEYYHTLAKYRVSDEYLKSALRILETEPSYKQRHLGNQLLGDNLAGQGIHSQALAYHFKAKVAAETGNLPKLLAQSQLAIATDLYNLKDYSQSMGFAQKAIGTFAEGDDRNAYAESLLLMGRIFVVQGRTLLAIQNFRNAAAIYKVSKNARQEVLANGLVAEVLLEQKQFAEAVGLIQQCRMKADSAGLRPELAEIYLLLGRCYFGQAETEKAIFYTTIALDQSQRLKRDPTQAESHKLLSSAYSSLGKYESAFIHFKAFSSLRDRLIGQENARQNTEMRVKYESEKIGKEIALLTRERKIQELDLSRKQYLIYFVVVGLFAALGIAALLLRRTITEQKLNSKLKALNTEIGHQKEEIEQQRDTLSVREGELNSTMGRLTSSINYAKRIQDALLPDTKILNDFFADSMVYFRPKDIVSGDFYWFAQAHGLIVIAVGDCTGHGVPGAFMSMIGHALLSKTVSERGILDPGTILREMHYGIQDSLKQQESANRDGIDLGICVYNPIQRSFTFAGAKCSMLLVSGQGVETLAGDRYSVGGLQMHEGNERHYRTTSHQLHQPTNLYMATDGLADQFEPRFEKKFSWPRLRSLFSDIFGMPMHEQPSAIEQALCDWREANEQTDDILVLGMRVG